MDHSLADLVMVEAINVQCISDILLSFGIYDDFKLQEVPNGNVEGFLQGITAHFKKKFRERRCVDLDCLVAILCEFSSLAFDGRFADLMSALIDLIPFCLMRNSSINKLVDIMRRTTRVSHSSDEDEDGRRKYLPLFLHPHILRAVAARLVVDDPPHMFFPGDKDSFLQISSIPWQCTTGYTLMIWMKIPSTTSVKGFELFRCRNPQLTIDAAMLYVPEENSFTVRVVTNSERRGRDEIRGKITMAADSWHLLTIKHTNPKDGADQMIISVDGTVFIESELNFPTTTALHADSHWTFGIGFHGYISNIMFHEVDLPLSAIKFIHSAGPSLLELKQGVSYPQSSYDSGHATLGTLLSKGAWPSRLNALPIGFSVNAFVLAAGETFTQSKLVDTSNCYMEMVPQGGEGSNVNDSLIVVSTTGRCLVSLNESCTESILEAGGCSLFLYLFWSYGYFKPSRDDSGRDRVAVRDSMLQSLNILSILIRSHCDLKEQFVQLHGFHVVAHCLLTVLQSGPAGQRSTEIDKPLIDAVMMLVDALGPDSLAGDGIASAFQGLLFDFRIWSSCTLSNLKYFLESMSTLALKASDPLFKSIGMQKVLDVFRMHISKVITASAAPSASLDGSSVHGSEDSGLMDGLLMQDASPEQLARDCANEIHRIMIIIKDAAVESALKSKSAEISLDIDALLICLAETNNSLLAERILRLLSNVRVTNPTQLQRGLIANRFYDTILIALWTKKGFSLEVRSSALSNLIWLLNLELHDIPQDIMQIRKNILQSSSSVSTKATDGQGGRSKSRAAPAPNDPIKSKFIIGQIREQVKPIVRWWKVLHLLAQVMSRTLEDGVWGDFSPACILTTAVAMDTLMTQDGLDASASQAKLSTSSVVEADRALWIMVQELTVSHQADAWIFLPFLPPLLARVDVDICQKVLMQLNVLFKTDEAQCEALAHLDDQTWMDVFVQLALIGELRSSSASAKSPVPASGLRCDDNVFSPEQTIASTCMELALEMLSIVLDYKIKFHPIEALHCWEVLEQSLSLTVKKNVVDRAAAIGLERKMLSRCASLVLQKLVKTGEEYWNVLTFKCVDQLLCLVSENNLCGSVSPFGSESESNAPADADLLGLEESVPAKSTQSCDEVHVLSLVLDLLRAVRKATSKHSFQGVEWSLLRHGFMVVLGSVRIVPLVLHDRMSEEIMGYIKRVTETATVPIGPLEFNKLIMQVLFTLKAVSLDKGIPNESALRAWCTSMIFDIISHFSELRRMLLTRGVTLPSHVEDILRILMCVENYNDITLIFNVLEAMVKEKPNGPSVASYPFEAVERSEALDDEAEAIIDYTAVPDAGDELFAFSLIDEFPVLPPSEAVSDAVVSNIEPKVTFAPPEPGVELPIVTPGAAAEASAGANVPNVSATPSHLKSFSNWLKVRQGIITDRIDGERARLTRIMNAQDLTQEATRKFWRRLRRKIESESFLEAHRCQWKLGVAHEGPFFGRKRIMLRPRFDNLNNLKSAGSVGDLLWASSGLHEEADISSDELNRALARQCSGYIKDVTRTENADSKEDTTIEASATAGSATTGGNTPIIVPGSGWGLVDADGSEDGFGVVGLLQDSAYTVDDNGVSKKDVSISIKPADPAKPPPSSAAPTVSPMPPASGPELSLVGDMMGDVHILEENLRNGRVVIETGPCHTGTYRVGSGLPKLESRVVMVTASGNFWGFLSFNGKEIFFRSSFEQEDVHKQDNAAVNLHKEQRMRRRRWLLNAVSGIYLRRFRLRDSALEVFFRRGKHRNFFVDFGHTKEDAKQRNDFAKALMAAAPSNAFKQAIGMTPFRMVYEHGVQEKWLSGRMSNFDYLMALNTLAGRSYNDLCQYPIMPWVLKDYSSASIDLKNPGVYRDLSKPMGALNENRLHEFLDRFHSFEDNITSGIPAFMYGSHYSTMVGVVLHFLVRMQPYAALHREMQNGHFDVSDRLFSSIPRSFQHNTTQLSEVKELIPEWFTTPDMFRNVNRFDFGHTQDGEVIDDVQLPPWASTPEEFVRINREALESDYVTEHLHDWIDLIFGYKQRGPDAIEANNVFYYLTYYGAVDHYMIEDETLRRATELQIAHFGQTPMQLFRSPHPSRKLSGPTASYPPARHLQENFVVAANNKFDLKLPRTEEESIAYHAPSTLVLRKSQSSVIQLTMFLDRAVCVLDNGVIEVIKYGTSDEAKMALQISAMNNASNSKEGGGRGSTRERNVRSRAPSLSDLKEKDKPKPRTEDLLGLDEQPSGPVRKYSNLSNTSQEDDKDSGYNIVPATASPLILKEGEVLIYAEKEFAHFESVPRVALPRHYRNLAATEASPSSPAGSRDALETLLKVRPQMQSSMSTLEKLSHLVTFSRSSRLCLAAGRIDGVVVVREIDDRTGFIKSAGEFAAHRKRVVSIAMDTNPPDYDVVASVDESGTILVWTILNSKPKASGGVLAQPMYVISRRPQRQFRCGPLPQETGDQCSCPIQLDISSHMGIVVAVAGEFVYLFSIERNELLRRFVLQCFQSSAPSMVFAAEDELKISRSPFVEYAFSGPESDTLESKMSKSASTRTDDLLAPKHFTRRMVLSDCGMVVVHVEAFVFVESSMEYEDQMHQQHLLIAHTVTGVHTQSLLCPSPVSCLVCPDRGEVVATGSHDGAVRLYRCQDLQLLYQFFPHLFCTPVSLSLPGGKPSGAGSANQTQRRKASVLATAESNCSIAPSRIIAITIGPNRSAPGLITVSTEAGAVYLKALPDFVRWEKQRQPSTLAQLVNSAPLQAVKGTLLQAQNWTQETAGVLAQNARSLADDAVSELKKLQRSSLVKGVVNFFGSKR